jgi:hypothetical protein
MKYSILICYYKLKKQINAHLDLKYIILFYLQWQYFVLTYKPFVP